MKSSWGTLPTGEFGWQRQPWEGHPSLTFSMLIVDYVLRIQCVVLQWLTFEIEETITDKLVENFWPRTDSEGERMYMISNCSTHLPLFLCLSFPLKLNRLAIFPEQSDSSLDFRLPCWHEASLPFTCPAVPRSQWLPGIISSPVYGAQFWDGHPDESGGWEQVLRRLNNTKDLLLFLITQTKVHWFLTFFFSGNFSVLYKCLRPCCQNNK